WPQHRHDAASHVLATVLPHAFHNRYSSAIPHRKTLARLPGNKESSGSRAVQNRIPRQHVAALGSILPGRDHDRASGKPFANVIVRFALQPKRHAGGEKRPEALSSEPLVFKIGGKTFA